MERYSFGEGGFSGDGALEIGPPSKRMNAAFDLPHLIGSPETVEAASEGARASQTLQRGLDLMDLVGRLGPISQRDLTERAGLTRSTAQRLIAALVERDLIDCGPRGYTLGAKLLKLAETARLQRPLPLVARPHLEALARAERDAVNLAIRDGDRVRYLDQVRGDRRMVVRSVVGETRPLTTTALGQALLLDAPVSAWRAACESDLADRGATAAWIAEMRQHQQQGVTRHIEQGGDQICCLAAAVRDASGRIVGAISLSSLAQYMDQARMAALAKPVRRCAEAISADLGWRPLDDRQL